MAFNIFEGSRRIAMLAAGVATFGTAIALFLDEPYVSATYSIAHPAGPFSRMDEFCPSDAGKSYFTAKTSSGKDVSITLCLLAMPFGENRDLLIPYKVDEKGMIWGAASYSTEVSAYEKELEKRFTIQLADEVQIENEFARRYREDLLNGFGYLLAGLAIFGGIVWAIGWIVRGFLSIPRGMDKRPD